MDRSIFRSKWIILAAAAMLVLTIGAMGCAKKEEAPTEEAVGAD